MKKLTAEKCRREIRIWERLEQTVGLAIESERHLQAYRIALPILEQQERGESVENNLKHVGYLFVNSGGGVVYSPSGYGMRGFTCLGKIYADTSLQPDRATNQNGGQ
ncbi:hypothetical protein ACR3LR_09300 [Pantoea eucalypti]|uniref:hypothetical protein n=1 Tax=Pantoea eucalypti TaxID=470933 RepID=UPI003EE46F3C